MLGYFRSSRIIFILLIVLYFIVTIIFYGIYFSLEYVIFICPMLYFLIWYMDYKRFNNLYKYWCNGEIEDYINKIEKISKYYHSKEHKNHLELLLAQCYNQTNQLDKTKKIIISKESVLSNLKTPNLTKADILLIICEYYIREKNYEEAENILIQIKDILAKSNLGESQAWGQNIYYMYTLLDFKIRCHNCKNKSILKEAEKFYINGMNNSTLTGKIVHADQLVTIYEKLGNKGKAKEYAKFLIENHKDYYIDPKRIEKYSN